MVWGAWLERGEGRGSHAQEDRGAAWAIGKTARPGTAGQFWRGTATRPRLLPVGRNVPPPFAERGTPASHVFADLASGFSSASSLSKVTRHSGCSAISKKDIQFIPLLRRGINFIAGYMGLGPWRRCGGRAFGGMVRRDAQSGGGSRRRRGTAPIKHCGSVAF
jgi:hypothetical protein